jgi:iron(III) transport system substrate-binding protein
MLRASPHKSHRQRSRNVPALRHTVSPAVTRRGALIGAAALAAGSLAAALVVRPAPAADPEVHVYSSRSHYGSERVFEEFSRETGIKVRIFGGNNNEVFERLRAEGPNTPADALVTVDAGNLWNAARAGLLQPVESRVLNENVPAHLRDPENRWFGLAVRARTIMYSTERVKPADLSTYEALGDPKWKGRLCLRPVSSTYNQSLFATWIKRHGEPKVERILKGWVANSPVWIDGDTKILEAIAAGQCDVGVTNTYYLARILNEKPKFPVAPFWADQQRSGVHVNVSGAGVTAHAKNRANAVRLIEFLSSQQAQSLFADASFEYPANPRVRPNEILRGWGTFKADDIGVASAGEFQAAAVRLADRVGYK